MFGSNIEEITDLGAKHTVLKKENSGEPERA
jgi:hypothetical protein